MQNKVKQVLEAVDAQLRWTEKSITEYMESVQYTALYIAHMNVSDVSNSVRMIGELQSLESKRNNLIELRERHRQLMEQKAALEFILKEETAC